MIFFCIIMAIVCFSGFSYSFRSQEIRRYQLLNACDNVKNAYPKVSEEGLLRKELIRLRLENEKLAIENSRKVYR